MIVGTVIGQVWATRKDDSLAGLRFLVVRPFTTDGDSSAETIIAVDPLGAGVGERVLVAAGRAARHLIGGARPSNRPGLCAADRRRRRSTV